MPIIYKLDELTYLRRYLNDVAIENLGTFTPPNAAIIYKLDELVYLRRYLNDV